MRLFSPRKNTPEIVAGPITSPEDAVRRINALVSDALGIGIYNKDPIESLTVAEKQIFGQQARDEYRNLDIVQRMIDAPAKDAFKNGYDLKTNYDDVVNLGKLIHERLDELDFDHNGEKFIIHYGIYGRGALMFPVLIESGMEPSREHLRRKLDLRKIEKIEALNVIREDLFFYVIQNYDPLARNFEGFDNFTLGGQTVHASRKHIAIDSPDPIRQRGVTQLQRIRTACRGLNIAEWTIVSLLMRYRAGMLSVPSAEMAANAPEAKKKAIGELINKIKMQFTAKSIAAIPDNYKLEYIETTFTGIKEACEYLWDFLSAVSHEPQSIIKGSAQGELASAKNDRQTWNSRVKAVYQTGLVQPLIRFLAPLILWEQSGEVFQACRKYGIDPDDVKVTVDFAPLDVADPVEKATV